MGIKRIIHYMKQMLKQTTDKRFLPEQLIYIAVWGIVFLSPVVDALFEVLSGSVESIRWKGIFLLWRDVLPFLFLFLLNNRLLLPYFFLRQKVTRYFLSAILLTALVMVAVSIYESPFPNERKREVETNMRPKPFERDRHFDFPHPPSGGRPLFIPLIRAPFFGRIMVALFMLSFNIAVKLFFKSLRDKETLKELERQGLQSELEYLKYQINPHFFMNTLNNIHALVDIDTEKAKDTIVELSKLMRYVLYEANNRTILLDKEVQFLRNYVELMRIRYPENVHIELSLPNEKVEKCIPPLLFISFVENAFKHGVSYQKDSFVSVGMELDESTLSFHCSNSKCRRNEDRHHGIGLENVRKRLQLLFGSNYTLSIRETDRQFDVLLVVPVS